MKNYLQANYDGSIFQYSKEEKEGYQKHENTVGKVSYRKYFNKGVDGTLVSVTKQNNQYLNGAEELKVTLQDGENENIISFTMLNQDGSAIDDYTEALALILPKLRKGEVYNVNNWFMKKGDIVGGEVVKYNNKGVTVKQNDVKIKSDLTFEHIKKRGTAEEVHSPGDVPMLKWQEIAGKNRPTAASKEARLVYLYTLIQDQITRLSTGETASTTVAPKSVAAKPVSSAASNTASGDDLPF